MASLISYFSLMEKDRDKKRRGKTEAERLRDERADKDKKDEQRERDVEK